MNNISTTELQRPPDSSGKDVKPVKKEGRFSNFVNKIKNKMKAPEPDAHEILLEMSKNTPESQEEILNVPDDINMDGENAKTPNKNGDRDEQESNPSPAPEEPKLTYAKIREKYAEENQVKWKIDDIAKEVKSLKSLGDLRFKDVAEREIKENLDWITQEPMRTSEAVTELQRLEKILNQASEIPNLTTTEIENIANMNATLETMRSGLTERGVMLSAPTDSTNNPQEKPSDTGSKETGTPVDLETAYEYAYHATPLRNVPSIAENGLQPSPEWSKEPGTIFFDHYSEKPSVYTPAIGMVFRTHLNNIPEFTGKDYTEDGKPYLGGGPAVAHSPIPPNFLEYSLDMGKTWRKDIGRFVEPQI